jgi:PAS domain S-box-containing protein
MKKEQFVKPGLIFLFILLLGLSGVGFYLLQQSVEAEELVVQTYEVIQIAQTILASVTDMETGVRGYIISGDERFLEPYYSGFPKNDSEITLLKRLTEDNAVQQSNITLLTSLIEKKQSICEVQMQLRRASGEEPAENHVSSGEGKVVMDSIRAVISAFMTVEKQLLKERLDKFHQSERQNLLFCSIIIIIQFCLFLLLAIVVLRYMKKQRMNRESIAKVNEELERQVKERTNNLEQSERAFRELSERNQAILDSVPDIIMEVNNDKEYIWANKTGIEFFGDDVIGKQASSYFLEEQDTYKVVEPLFKKESENVIYVESWQRRRDGEKRLLGWWCRALKDANGNVIGAISSAEDITERKLAEEHLAQLLRQNESILESIVDGIYGIDLNGNVTFINKAGARLLGYEQTELLGQHIHTLCHHTKKDGTPFPASECPIYLALTDGRVHREFDDVFWRKDGNKFPIEYISSPIVEDGTIVGAVVSFKDITERKKAEERIKHQAMLIDFINDAIIHLDAQYNILSWNKGAERMYGIRQKKQWEKT